jgi:hypothetical protein
MTNAELKKKSCQQAASAPTDNPSASSAVTTLTSEAALQIRQESTKKLQTYQGKQNFQPLVYFLVGGVRGLFLLSKNAQTASVSECMSFMQAMAVIHEHSQVDQTPEEKIWSNLSAYLVELLRPSFQSPGKIVPIQQKPDPHHLAKAITIDFLNHWKIQQPTSPFLIPEATQQITEK